MNWAWPNKMSRKSEPILKIIQLLSMPTSYILLYPFDLCQSFYIVFFSCCNCFMLSKLTCYCRQGFSISLANTWKKLISHPYTRLCRYDKPIGAMLLFWPTAWGVAAASCGLPTTFLLGSWTSRAAGCIINDYFDQDFDRNVTRTKLRPLASKEVSIKTATQLLFLNLLGGVYVLTILPSKALYATAIILPIAAVYPLAKRYFSHPQFVLGIAFNSGIIIGALTVTSSVNIPAIFSLYVAGIVWTMVYDTVYALQDIKDDLKQGIKSTAVTWGDNVRVNLKKATIVSWASASAVCFFDPSLNLCFPFFTSAYLFLYKKLKKLDQNSTQECSDFFKFNNKFGAAIFFSLLISKGIYYLHDF